MSQMMKLKTPLHWMRGVLLALLVLAGMPQQVLAQMTVTYFHNEISGSAVAASDSAGRVVWKENYRPYGERQVKAAGSESNGVWFAGKPQEARSGLVYMGARYYDPVAGRFMGVDPLGWQEDNLHSFNRYAYANNNPYRYVDPDGQMPAIAWAVFEVVAWLGARSAATVAVVETGAVIASGAVSPPVAMEGVVAKAAGTAAKEGERYIRLRNGEESVARLAKQAAAAEAHPAFGIHGVSVFKDKLPPHLAHRMNEACTASCQALETAFRLERTGNTPGHFTVELPKPVTQDIADVFNRMFTPVKP